MDDRPIGSEILKFYSLIQNNIGGNSGLMKYLNFVMCEQSLTCFVRCLESLGAHRAIWRHPDEHDVAGRGERTGTGYAITTRLDQHWAGSIGSIIHLQTKWSSEYKINKNAFQ